LERRPLWRPNNDGRDSARPSNQLVTNADSSNTLGMKSVAFVFRLVFAILFLALCSTAVNAADSAGWVGEYTDKKFLSGRAVFQLSIDQSGSAMQIRFDAAWNDGHAAAPEADGPGKVSGNTLTFKWEDTFKNSGTGTIKRSGDDIIVSIDATHVADPRCLPFYGKNMRLKRAAKK
jgi:hypothetical protein